MSVPEYVLEAHPFLKGVAKKYLNNLAANADLLFYEKGDVIFREGTPAEKFYLITNGTVVLECIDSPKQEFEITRLMKGDVLGWSWMIEPYIWRFAARTLEPTEVIELSGHYLRDQCNKDSALGYELMRRINVIVVDRLQKTRKQLLDHLVSGE